ncbi:M56 family metallopeptidase [Tundrisphaera sp. TA3]|uniref:M56 family metallopeptidase n=1 Tax=Tundrisphaera sp. TA3 TaxID=3435775 RepID=UPI003EBA11D5
MNHAGLTLAWLAIQDGFVLAPALAVHAWASRRGPAAGAWVASLSLALVLALGMSAFWPRSGRPAGPIRAPLSTPIAVAAGRPASPVATDPSRSGPTLGGWSALRSAWARAGRGVAAPAAQWRPWGRAVAWVAGPLIGFGLIRLALGMVSLAVCLRRARPVDDPGLATLLGELRYSMGCRRPVRLREVDDVGSPATAGWRRPTILLPPDWRDWDASERRAVLAHELAHIIRGDYAAGLLARLAVALHAFHPMVRAMASRLLLQQEMAADALGAQFSGGRTDYLVALARLALRQDGRAPVGPARAFLPGRGALIRRIAMLRDESPAKPADRPWSPARKGLISLALLGTTVAVASFRPPALAEDAPAPARPAATLLAPVCFGDNMDGVLTFRPAAAFRHPGLERIAADLDAYADKELIQELVRMLRVDPTRSGFLRISVRDIEWISVGIGLDLGGHKSEDKLHRLTVGGTAIRLVSPFDWLAYLRQWRLELTEAGAPGQRLYRVGFDGRPVPSESGGVCFAHLPDDRTLMLGSEAEIRATIARGPATPPLIDQADWARASRGLMGLTLANPGGAMVKRFDLGRPDDAVFLSLFRGVERWTLGVEDAEPIQSWGSAACVDDAVGSAIAAVLRSYWATNRAYPKEDGLGKDLPVEPEDLFLVLCRRMIDRGVITQEGRSVLAKFGPALTNAEFAEVIARYLLDVVR